jgi:RNA polymerase sigma-70 factor (ECF subfamily)
LPVELTLRIGTGSPSAAASAEDDVLALFDECAPGLQRYVRSCGLNADAAEDVVQETFLALFRHLRLGRSRANLRGWLFLVGYRLARKHQLRTARRDRIEIAWQPRAEDATTDPRDTVEQQMVADQRGQRLRSVIRALPVRDRQCLLLRAEGLRYREIAHALGLSLGGVAKSLSRAMTRIANSEAD